MGLEPPVDLTDELEHGHGLRSLRMLDHGSSQTKMLHLDTGRMNFSTPISFALGVCSLAVAWFSDLSETILCLKDEFLNDYFSCEKVKL